MRYALGLEYDGSHYHGWQQQSDLASVQAYLQNALTKIAEHPITVHCAGRTDAGVHALGQVVHFDTNAVREERAWLWGTNSHLPKDIRVIWVKPVGDDFHARFSAIARRYRYVIYNHPICPVLGRQWLTWCYRHLNIARMQTAAAYLIGTHDFSAFRASECQAHSPIRSVEFLKLVRQGEIITLDIKANAFLHHMVRNIAGVLMAIGTGKQAPIWAQEVLLSRNRAKAGVTAPASGLSLLQVYYPASWQIPAGRIPSSDDPLDGLKSFAYGEDSIIMP